MDTCDVRKIYCVARWRGIRERDIRCERNKQVGGRFIRQVSGHTASPADTCYPILDTREEQSITKWVFVHSTINCFMVSSLVQARTTMTTTTTTTDAPRGQLRGQNTLPRQVPVSKRNGWRQQRGGIQLYVQSREGTEPPSRHRHT